MPQQLQHQPAFQRGFHVANDGSIKLPGSFADEFGELNGLDALDVDVALLPQPGHAGQCHLVRSVLELFGDQDDAGQCQSSIGLGRQHERITRFAHYTEVNEPHFAGFWDCSHA